MKNFAKLSLSAILFALIFSFSANAQNILPEILKRMDDHNKALTSLKADVTMVKTVSQLGVEDEYKGKVAYRPNGKDIAVRIDWTSPQEETLSVLNGKYVIYRPRLNQVLEGKADGKGKNSAGGALSFLNMNKQQLKANYNVVYAGKETVSGVECWRLTMTPKNKAGYKQAELWIDGNGMPRQSKVTENTNDITTVVLSGLEKNVTIAGTFFAVQVPANAKKIKG